MPTKVRARPDIRKKPRGLEPVRYFQIGPASNLEPPTGGKDQITFFLCLCPASSRCMNCGPSFL
jgi:hypothetical protein